MHKLKKLDEVLKTINGLSIAHIDKNPLTIRSALISVCELHKPVPGSGEAIRAYDLGIKIHNAKDEMEITKDEVNFLMDLVAKSEVFFAVVIGLLTNYLQEAWDEKKVEKTKD